MKKILVLILVFTLLLLCSCETINDISSSKKEKTASFTAVYDYGFHQSGKVSLLLDGSTVFFDSEAWDIDPLIAGDVIVLTYIGNELLIQESYPSTVVTKDIEIVSITAEYADVMMIDVTHEEGSIAFVAYDSSINEVQMSGAEQYVISDNSSFTTLDESFVGETIYASGKINGDTFVVSALYDYMPRTSD